MPKFSANLTMLFPEYPFLERFAAAARCGFKAVEYVAPYAFDKNRIADLLQQHGLQQALFNLPAGNWDAGERGIACMPARQQEFRDSVGHAIAYAKALRCPTLNCLAGLKPADLGPDVAFRTLVDNLKFAAQALAAENILLVVEPINSFDMPGFLLNRSSDGVAAMDAVRSPNLKLQYDLYHMQRMEGEIAATLTRLMPRIGHIQIADNPGRHEPGTGELNYAYLLHHIDALGYDGWVGCEYKPRAGTAEGLGWMRALAV
jgi:hydroxypyruvate isomerase